MPNLRVETVGGTLRSLEPGALVCCSRKASGASGSESWQTAGPVISTTSSCTGRWNCRWFAFGQTGEQATAEAPGKIVKQLSAVSHTPRANSPRRETHLVCADCFRMTIPKQDVARNTLPPARPKARCDVFVLTDGPTPPVGHRPLDSSGGNARHADHPDFGSFTTAPVECVTFRL